MRVLTTTLAMLAISSSAHALTLTSESIAEGKTLDLKYVYNGFDCSGKNLSPQFSWSNVPAGTKSLAITAYDPDAPTGSGWWHWVAFNIPLTATKLDEGASGKGMPKGTVESLTDYGTPGFGGACPPKGDKPHRYIFTLWALKDTLPLDAKASGAMVGFYLNQNKIESVTIEAKFGR